MRLRVVYEPKGRAREYAQLAANLYRGCDHGCTYCYAPSVIKVDRDEFRCVTPRRGVVSALERDARQLAADHDERPIQLCFTCDPYPKLDDKLHLARSAILVLKEHGRRVQILTKGGVRAERDLDLLGAEDAVGCTLTFLDSALSVEREPGAAPPAERVALLQAARKAGIRTWASIEPVIDPLESLGILRVAARHLDEVKLGAWNYDAAAREIDWSSYLDRAEEMLTKLGIPYMVKADLLERAGRG